jgi:hypothetical protein
MSEIIAFPAETNPKLMLIHKLVDFFNEHAIGMDDLDLVSVLEAVKHDILNQGGRND